MAHQTMDTDNVDDLSRHSSLEDGDLNLEEVNNGIDTETQNKERTNTNAKKGINSENLKISGAVVAASGTNQKIKKKEKTVAEALKIAGGVAVAGASWTPNRTKLTHLNPAQDKSKFKAAGNAAVIAAKAEKYRKSRKTVSEALRIAGGLAIAAASWTPDRAKLREAAKAKLTQTPESYSIESALAKAGAVAIAGASWSWPKPTSRDSQKFTNTGSSPIPELLALLRPQTADSIPYGRGETPELATLLLRPETQYSIPYGRGETPWSSFDDDPPLYRNYSVASATVTTPSIIVINETTSPAPSIPAKTAETPALNAPEQRVTPAPSVPAKTAETPAISAPEQRVTPAPSVPAKTAETPALSDPGQRVTPAPSVPTKTAETPAISAPEQRVTPAPSIPTKTAKTPAISDPEQRVTPAPSVPGKEVFYTPAYTPIIEKQTTPSPIIYVMPVMAKPQTPPHDTPDIEAVEEKKPHDTWPPSPVVQQQKQLPAEPQPTELVQQRRRPLAKLSVVEKIAAKAKMASAASNVATMQRTLARWTNG